MEDGILIFWRNISHEFEEKNVHFLNFSRYARKKKNELWLLLSLLLLLSSTRRKQHAIKIDESTNLRLVIIFNALHGRRRFALIFKLWQYRKSILMAWRVLDFLPSNINYSCRQMRKFRENSSYTFMISV